ncbi:hypothetical protein Tco_0064874 [Tanacetum coccineum]
MSRRYGYMFRHLKTSFMLRKDFKAITDGVHATLKKVDPSMIDHNTNDFMKNNLPKIKFERPTPLRDHEDHHDDDARTEGESSAKRQKTYEFGTYTAGIDDDEVPIKEVSPELLVEVSEREMTSDGEEHQYHLDQMESYMKNQNVWESREEDLTMHIPKKPAPFYLSCARNPKISPKSLKSPWAQQDHIRRKIKKRDNPDEIYSDEKIVDVVRVQFDQGYGPEYMTEIVVKRANSEYSWFIESDYKYLYKNNIEDMCLMCINRMIKDYGQTGLLSKQEKRVMDIKEIPKFCDATLKRVLEKMKKFNLNVKHGYADPDLSVEDA